MVKHVWSVCIFCFICATHSPCSSHGDISSHNILQQYYDKPSTINNDPLNEPTVSVTDHLYPPLQVTLNNSRKERRKVKRDISSNGNSTKGHIEKLFTMFGNGKTMTVAGFEAMLQKLDLLHIVENLDSKMELSQEKTTEKCVSREDLYHATNPHNDKSLTSSTLYDACPILLYSALVGICPDNDTTIAQRHNHHDHNDHQMSSNDNSEHNHDHTDHTSHDHNVKMSHDDGVRKTEEELQAERENNRVLVWIYSMCAVCVISLCGVFGLAVIPVMQKTFYQPLLQFLVALAVGTLAGDALLHLLPHAMTSVSKHDHGNSNHGHNQDTDDHDGNGHDENIWKGFVAMLGLVLFFFMERIIMLVAKWRKSELLKDKQPTRLKVMDADKSTSVTNATEKQCKHKYSSFPYCYDEIKMLDAPNTTNNDGHIIGPITVTSVFDTTETNQNMTQCPQRHNNSDHHHDDDDTSHCTEVNRMLTSDSVITPVASNSNKASNSNSNKHSHSHHGHHSERVSKADNDSGEYTVILREHENRHHGHSHTHGHVHAAPKNMSSVVWMVIMGDGLHNFTDGMAIGAAFSGSITGGLSTALAVFCHELPHELGDFAMLLKAGMSMRWALFYNLMSSVLCLLGNVFGVWLGHNENATAWVFAAAAGMFLYIALVDMIPELSSGHSGGSEEETTGTLLQCVLHMSGLLLGVTIMMLIACYEHELRNVFRDNR